MDPSVSHTSSQSLERQGGPPADSRTAAIDVDGLVFEYATTRALHCVTFRIEHGSVIALVGPNGAGKTTLLRCMAALEMPFQGRVRVCGLDTEESPRECHHHLAYLADTFGLFEDLSAERCLLHAAAMRGLQDEAARVAIDDAVRALDLKSLLNMRAGDMSRGQRQRLAIAQTILHRPRVLLLDEPASGLDPEARSDLAALIRRLSGEGMTIVVSSHILAELEDYSSHMLTIEGGHVCGFERIGSAHHAPEGDASIRTIRVLLAGADERIGPWLAQRGLTFQAVEERAVARFAYDIEMRGGLTEQSELLNSLIGDGFMVCEFVEQRQSLQDRYLAQRKSRSAATGPSKSAKDS